MRQRGASSRFFRDRNGPMGWEFAATWGEEPVRCWKWTWRRIADDSGQVKQVTVPKRVKAWWWKGDNGKTFLGVRYGNRMLELAKGKAAVEMANGKELISVLGTLRKAVEQGELDAQIEAVGAAVKARLKKK
jgi:hypothetical protein